MTAVVDSASPLALDPLLDLLRSQVDCYRRLDELAQQQGALIAAGEPDPLLSLLARRQTLVERLTSLTAGLEPYQAQWDRFFRSLGRPQQEEVRALVQQIGVFRESLLARDEADTRSLRRSQQQLSRQIEQVTRGGRASQAYQPGPAATPSRFTDQHG